MIFTKEKKYLLPSLMLFIYCFLVIGQNTEAKSFDSLYGAKVVCYMNEIEEPTKSTITDNLWWYSANAFPICKSKILYNS
ncbi:MAG: hypothetical protein GX915_08935 [Clostridiales bacterium]|nr:hypothetical protein [Clostridiales bacterium]